MGDGSTHPIVLVLIGHPTKLLTQDRRKFKHNFVAKVHGKDVHFQVQDLGGRDYMDPSLDADGWMFMYDVTCRSSFEILFMVYRELAEARDDNRVPRTILGWTGNLEPELPEMREVKHAAAKGLADKLQCKFYEMDSAAEPEPHDPQYDWDDYSDSDEEEQEKQERHERLRRKAEAAKSDLAGAETLTPEMEAVLVDMYERVTSKPPPCLPTPRRHSHAYIPEFCTCHGVKEGDHKHEHPCPMVVPGSQHHVHEEAAKIDEDIRRRSLDPSDLAALRKVAAREARNRDLLTLATHPPAATNTALLAPPEAGEAGASGSTKKVDAQAAKPAGAPPMILAKR